MFAPPPNARSYFDFGPVLPIGLTRDDLTTKLKVAGAYAASGAVDPIVFSVDGDILFEQVVKRTTRFVPFEKYVIYAESEVELPAGNSREVYLSYRWDGDASRRMNPSAEANAYLQYRASDDEDWKTLVWLNSCLDRCDLAAVLTGQERTVQLRVVNQSTNSPLSLESLEFLSAEYRQTVRLPLDVQADEVVTINRMRYDRPLQIRDASERLVATSNRPLRLAGENQGVTRYYVDIEPTSPLIDLSVSGEKRVAVDRRFTVQSYTGQFTLSAIDSLDLRTCDLSRVAWDGPDFNSRQIYDSDAMFTFTGPFEQRNYTIRVPEHACRTTAGDWMSGGPYTVDYRPPELVSIPLDNGSVYPVGTVSKVLSFDEPVWPEVDYTNVVAIRRDATLLTEVGVSVDSSFDNKGIRLRFPALEPGVHEVTINGIVAVDFAGNRRGLQG